MKAYVIVAYDNLNPNDPNPFCDLSVDIDDYIQVSTDEENVKEKFKFYQSLQKKFPNFTYKLVEFDI